MRILFISDNFPPEVNAPANRIFEHAKIWVELGHEVTVVTCAPNFPEGRVYTGYKNKWRSTEKVDGISVVRVKTYITPNSGFAKRIIDYLSFMLSASFFGLFEKGDVVVATSPQFFTSFTGVFLSFLKRIPFVFEVRDLWPASILAVGAMKKSKIILLLEHLELFMYRRARKVITVTQSLKEDMQKRGIDPNKIEIVYNGIDVSRFRAFREKDRELENKFGLKNKIVVTYFGTIGMAHCVDQIVTTAKILQDDDRFYFLIAGDGAGRTKLEQAMSNLKPKNLIYIGKQAREVMPQLWSLADCTIVPLKNDLEFEKVIPSKIFEAFGMQVPIIISLPKNGEAVKLVLENHCGLHAEPEDPESLKNAILKMFDSGSTEIFKKNQAKIALSFDRSVLAKSFVDHFEEII